MKTAFRSFVLFTVVAVFGAALAAVGEEKKPPEGQPDEAEIQKLMVEVREHDPLVALDGGADGLAAIRAIVAGASEHLHPGGLLAVETGATQGESVAGLFIAAGLESVTTRRDLSGLDRVVMGRLPARKS